MFKIVLAASALLVTASALPAAAYDGYRSYRGEYNRYSPDSRNPELERRYENRLLHERSRQRARILRHSHDHEIRAHKPTKRVHRRGAWRSWR